MKRLQQLKHEARQAEQRSDWVRAIALYKDAIQLGEDAGSPADAGMYNRVGDLHLRQGDPPAAVEYYLGAADRYASQGLHTSAIALCNKILRIAPDQDDVYGRLARLHASTGLRAEARSAFLQFADRMRARNRLSDALEAVQELVGITGDEELRTAFAEQLVEAGLEAQAVAQLRLVYESRVAGGRNAQDIRDRILALDPAADPVAKPAAAPPRATTTPEPPVASPVGESPEASMEDLLGMQSMLETDGAQPTDVPPDAEAAPPIGPPGDVADIVVDEAPDMDSVITRFRSQILDIVEETDYAVHYDLGVAYMGMGLLDEAIGEFQLAIQSPGQIDAAHALLGECLRARASQDGDAASAAIFGTPAQASGADASSTAPLPAVAEPSVPSEPSVRPEPVPGEEGSAPPVAPAAPEAPTGGSDDLADMLFQARLAQHRVRQAEETGGVDHEAHLELGRTYSEMALHTEAVDNLVRAAAGPRSVMEDALAELESLANDDSVDASPMRDALRCLLASGRTAAAASAARRFLARPDLGDTNRLAVIDVLPADMVTSVVPEREVEAPPETQDVLGDIMDELEDAADVDVTLDPAPVLSEPEVSPAALFGEAEGLREAGRMDEAAAHYYRALELYEKQRDALSAIRVVDRLLALRPDDVVLHHQKTEFAIMTNDRELLLSAYLDLASCLRRQNGHRSARTVYGRILDLDAGNAEARAGLAALDAEELTRERQRRETPPPDHGPSTVPPASTPGPEDLRAAAPVESDFDEMLGELRESDGQDTDYESHHQLGIAFRQLQMWEEAVRELKLAVQGMAEPLPAYEILGEALIELGRHEEARRVLSTAVDHPTDDEAAKVGVLFHLGVAHLRAGDRTEARTCLERAVQIDPARSDAAQLLSTLSR